ncbi:hypothetical protein BDK51DRAFT_46112, partial [Blyttiomyces helicus]
MDKPVSFYIKADYNGLLRKVAVPEPPKWLPVWSTILRLHGLDQGFAVAKTEDGIVQSDSDLAKLVSRAKSTGQASAKVTLVPLDPQLADYLFLPAQTPPESEASASGHASDTEVGPDDSASLASSSLRPTEESTAVPVQQSVVETSDAGFASSSASESSEFHGTYFDTLIELDNPSATLSAGMESERRKESVYGMESYAESSASDLDTFPAIVPATALAAQPPTESEGTASELASGEAADFHFVLPAEEPLPPRFQPSPSPPTETTPSPDTAPAPEYTPAPAAQPESSSAPGTSKQSADEFMSEVQPLIDALITKLDSRPDLLPALIGRLESSLA